jgi:hypothetical protein
VLRADSAQINLSHDDLVSCFARLLLNQADCSEWRIGVDRAG